MGTIRTKADAIKLVEEQYQKHTGEWLMGDVVKDYQRKVNSLSTKNHQDIAERRNLRIELQEKYGLLEIEAINILNKVNIGDYINKYYRIMNKIPLDIKEKKSDLK